MAMQFKRKIGEDRGQQHSPERQAATVSVLHHASANLRPDAGLPPRAVLDAAMKIVGSLQADGDVQVDAKIDGDVRCRQLTIGKCGMISGDITAEEVVIRGTVKGAIRASRVIIQHGAHVQSDISPDKLSIEEGSYFKGTIIQKDREEPDASPETAIPLKVG
jgi:cytoskeletal protein CcmA (bactofilin family)